MRLRNALILAVLSLGLGACGGVSVTRVFASAGDFQTSVPRSLAEGGHSAPVVPPAGVTWLLSVAAYEEMAREGTVAMRYELRIVLTDRQTPPGTWRLQPVFDSAELVDDESARFACTRAILPEVDPDARPDPDVVPTREYVLSFDVPSGYRFKQIGRVVVHWGLSIAGGRTVPITSRFRAI